MIFRPAQNFRNAPARLLSWAGLLLLLLCLVTRSAASQSEVLTWEAYWQRIEGTRAGLTATFTEAEWEKQADAWAAVKAVRLPDGTTEPVDSGYLAALLRQNQPDTAKIRRYLDALLEVRDARSQEGDRVQEVAAIQEILTRPEFQWEEERPNPIVEFFRDLLRAFARWLHRNDPGDVVGTSLEWLWAIAILAAFAAVLYFATRGIWKGVLQEADVNDEAGTDGEILTNQQAANRARQFFASGDYRQAIRYQYLAALLLLDERGLLNYRNSLTNREVLRQVAKHQTLAAHLQAVIETFDRTWYGYQSIDETAYTQYTEQVAQLEQIIKSKDPAHTAVLSSESTNPGLSNNQTPNGTTPVENQERRE